MQVDSPPGRDAAYALLHGLPGLQRSESELANRVRARVSYDSLMPDLS